MSADLSALEYHRQEKLTAEWNEWQEGAALHARFAAEIEAKDAALAEARSALSRLRRVAPFLR